jgi:HEAT repeat protein
MLSVAILLVVSTTTILQGDPVERAWSVLNDALTNKTAEKRAEGVQALGSVKLNEKAEALAEKALNDPDSGVRTAAAMALGHLKVNAARPKLREALKDKQVKVVLAAADALYAMHDPAAYDVYYALVTGERKSSEGLVQSQLDTLRDRKQLEQLAFETGIGFVPFGGMGWQAWKTLTHDDSSPVKAAAAEKLAGDRDPKSGEALLTATNDSKWRVRAAAANAIGLRGDRKMLTTVSNMLMDDNESVRLQAAAAVIVLSSNHPAHTPVHK